MRAVDRPDDPDFVDRTSDWSDAAPLRAGSSAARSHRGADRRGTGTGGRSAPVPEPRTPPRTGHGMAAQDADGLQDPSGRLPGGSAGGRSLPSCRRPSARRQGNGRGEPGGPPWRSGHGMRTNPKPDVRARGREMNPAPARAGERKLPVRPVPDGQKVCCSGRSDALPPGCTGTRPGAPFPAAKSRGDWGQRHLRNVRLHPCGDPGRAGGNGLLRPTATQTTASSSSRRRATRLTSVIVTASTKALRRSR